MLIRNARLEDWEEIFRIEHGNFPVGEAATADDLKKRIKQSQDTFLVAEIGDKIAGYIVGSAVNQRYLTDNLFHEVSINQSTGGFIVLISLSIQSDFQKQGIGTALLAALKDLAVSQKREGISLTCHDYLINYYECNGFVDEGESLSAYGGGIWYNLVWENPYF